MLPKQARYQAALHPAGTGSFEPAPVCIESLTAVLVRDADQFADYDRVVFV